MSNVRNFGPQRVVVKPTQVIKSISSNALKDSKTILKRRHSIPKNRQTRLSFSRDDVWGRKEYIGGLDCQGRPHGIGKLEFVSEVGVQSFEGSFKNGSMVNGAFVWENGEQYTGDCSKGYWAHGIGSKIYLDKSHYSGLWEKSLKHGFGVLTHPNGEKYAGQFLCDSVDGVGYYLWTHGRYVQLKFHENVPLDCKYYARFIWVLGIAFAILIFCTVSLEWRNHPSVSHWNYFVAQLVNTAIKTEEPVHIIDIISLSENSVFNDRNERYV